MKASQSAPASIAEYIASFPPDIQTILEQVRLLIQEAVPDAEEVISYQMPTFRLYGSNLIYFAAYKKHIGLYPAPIGDNAFNQELLHYAAGKSTIRFPLDKPMPAELIRKIVALRVTEHLELAAAKQAAAQGKKR